ncbi:MAG: dipeptidase [Bacteroidota bacterium]|nr:dipeptidase [Flavisolibacter sp.]MBD0294673.1 dipeptidase [Flavisolibacter sp.]MBD0350796.1 dipeptidase [Flavisolibacter sp.]MBD0375063.1 dipeptidase [Flavisolibacter sp.]MDQ3843739.1 dipeptidase [Bacteroidota bacterium]
MKRISFLLFFLWTFSAPAQLYQRLHRKATVVDTHNDVLSTATLRGLNIEQDLSRQTHSDIRRFQSGGVDVQVFSIFCDERYGKGTAFAYANREIDSLYAIVQRNPDKLMLVTNPAQLKQAVRQKKLACMMGVEGGHMIEDNMAYLDSFYKRGVRYMTLTWNNSTDWATSAKDETSPQPSPSGEGGGRVLNHKGLTEFGKQVVRRMNDLGMIVDVSHVGERTFWDAINTTTKPVIASHSCVYTLCPVFRNLKDEQIKAIGKNGGVIHLNFFSGFIDSNYNKRLQQFNTKHQSQIDSLKALKWVNWEIEEWMAKAYPQEAAALRPPLSLLLDHLDYIIKLIGVDHVGLGSDFDGISSAPQGLDDVSDFPLITKALLERGYRKKEIKKILGGNFLRVVQANERE